MCERKHAWLTFTLGDPAVERGILIMAMCMCVNRHAGMRCMYLRMH